MAKKKILLIEDNPDQVIMVRKRLESSGYEVVVALDGKDGIKKADDEKPDLILLDILLPKMDGDRVCEEIRANPETSNIPIIIVTAIGAEELKDRCLVFGAEDWIQKPYDSQVLLDKIKKTLV